MKRLIKEWRSIFEKNDIYKKLEVHNKKILDVNFWKDKSNSQKVIKEKKLYEELVSSYEKSINNLKDFDELNKLAIEERNTNFQIELLKNIKDLRELVKKNEIRCFLSSEADSLDCYIEIHAGAGGTESQDWA